MHMGMEGKLTAGDTFNEKADYIRHHLGSLSLTWINFDLNMDK